MPPYERDTRGWKAFFALLMVLQIIAIGVMWRTYDAVSAVTAKSNLNEYKIEQVIFPQLRQHEDQLRRLRP